MASCDNSSITSSSSDPSKVSSVTLNKDTYELYYLDSYTLEATVYPETATNKSVTWKSDNPDVCNVSNGVLIPYKKGVATITVTTIDNNKTDSCVVSVIDRTDKYNTKTNESHVPDGNI